MDPLGHEMLKISHLILQCIIKAIWFWIKITCLVGFDNIAKKYYHNISPPITFNIDLSQHSFYTINGEENEFYIFARTREKILFIIYLFRSKLQNKLPFILYL